jgi:hypothetical protein
MKLRVKATIQKIAKVEKGFYLTTFDGRSSEVQKVDESTKKKDLGGWSNLRSNVYLVEVTAPIDDLVEDNLVNIGRGMDKHPNVKVLGTVAEDHDGSIDWSTLQRLCRFRESTPKELAREKEINNFMLAIEKNIKDGLEKLKPQLEKMVLVSKVKELFQEVGVKLDSSRIEEKIVVPRGTLEPSVLKYCFEGPGLTVNLVVMSSWDDYTEPKVNFVFFIDLRDDLKYSIQDKVKAIFARDFEVRRGHSYTDRRKIKDLNLAPMDYGQ